MKKRITDSAVILYIYEFFVIWRILSLSMLSQDTPSAYRLISNIARILIFLGVGISFRTRKIRIREVVTLSVLLIACILINLFSGYGQISLVVLLIISCRNISFERIVKASFLAQSVAFSLVLLGAFTGILRNLTYNHTVKSSLIFSSNQVHSYGFLYYTFPAYIVLSMMIEWFYLHKNKARLSHFLIWGVIQVISFYIFSSRASFLMGLLFLAMYPIIMKTNLDLKIWKWMSNWGFLVMFALCVFCIIGYRRGDIVFSYIDLVISGRLKYASEAFTKYGITLFGNSIMMIGGYEHYYLGVSDYFYIDSGYAYCLICYGIVMTGLLLCAYTLIYRETIKENNNFIYLWIFIYMIMNSTNNMLVSLQYCPILLLLPQAISKIKWTRMPVRISLIKKKSLKKVRIIKRTQE